MWPSSSSSFTTTSFRLATFVNLAFPSKFASKVSSPRTSKTDQTTCPVGDRGEAGTTGTSGTSGNKSQQLGGTTIVVSVFISKLMKWILFRISGGDLQRSWLGLSHYMTRANLDLEVGLGQDSGTWRAPCQGLTNTEERMEHSEQVSE